MGLTSTILKCGAVFEKWLIDYKTSIENNILKQLRITSQNKFGAWLQREYENVNSFTLEQQSLQLW